MLYDKKWNKTSLDSLIAWLEVQDPAEEYRTINADHCLLARWLQSIDPSSRSHPHASNSYEYLFHNEKVDLRHFSDIVFRTCDFNFGGALRRARELRGY